MGIVSFSHLRSIFVMPCQLIKMYVIWVRRKELLNLIKVLFDNKWYLPQNEYERKILNQCNSEIK